MTFIDPNFADIPPAATANDDHAPADLRLGQRLVAEIHDALRSSPDWVTGNGGTLYVVICDEHSTIEVVSRCMPGSPHASWRRVSSSELAHERQFVEQLVGDGQPGRLAGTSQCGPFFASSPA